MMRLALIARCMALVGAMPSARTLTPHEDYTAGEVDAAIPIPFGYPNDPHPVGYGRWVVGSEGHEKGNYSSQFHILTFLGNWWGSGQPRINPELLGAYTRQINDAGGMMTWDIPVSDSGMIADSFKTAVSALPLTCTLKPRRKATCFARPCSRK